MRKNPPRKLAAILFADIAGYSRLMAADEPATLDAFKKLLRADIRPAVRKYDGRIIKTLGDGFLGQFDSPVNAVNCAFAIQEASVRRHRNVPDGQRLHLRIGINFGDIIIDGEDIAGDAVNVASRLEALADPDGIIITKSTLEHVKGKTSYEFQDIGAHALKHIPDPVALFRCVVPHDAPGMGVAAASSFQTIPVVAVLPFTSIGADTHQQYFSDGISEDIITELTRFRTISVIARNSSFLYRGGATDVQKIGRELNAQFLVEGSTRHVGKNLRITVQLIHVASRRQVWAERYDTSLDKLFEVQDDITHRVVGTLVPRIESQELEVARRRPTMHMRAYDCYLRGRAEYIAARDGSAIDRARRHFEEAIALDPRFARAYVQLAKIENTMTIFTAAGAPLDERRQRAWELTLKAASLDDSDPMAHLSLAWGHLYRGEFDAAKRHLTIATELNPNDAELAVDRGTTLMCLGEAASAVEVIKGGIRLNPFYDDWWLADLAEALYAAGRYEEMIAVADQIVDPTPRFTAWRAAGYAMAGREAEAKQYADQFVRQLRAIWAGGPNPGPEDYIAWLLSWSPFRRQEDTKHLVEGLRRAGIQVS